MSLGYTFIWICRLFIMPNDKLKYLLQYNALLRRKIEPLSRHVRSSLRARRYYDAIMEYFSQTRYSDDEEDIYENVWDAVVDLWVSSDKDPSIFKNAKEFEPILLKSTEPYRDHFIHSFNVFLLGYYIINKLFSSSNFDAIAHFGNRKRANLTWMLASTFHDVGYAIQETESWLNRLFEKFFGVNPDFSFGITEVLPVIYVDFMRALSAFHKTGIMSSKPFSASLEVADLTFYDKVGSKLIMKDHGVLSGLMLAHLLAIKPSNRTTDMWDFFFDHMPACHAILSHTLESVRIQFYKHPFAFLLILLDEIQDYGRPSNLDTKRLIRLLDLHIKKSRVPEIKFIIEVNREGKEQLELLSRRLGTNGKIRVSLFELGEKKAFLEI